MDWTEFNWRVVSYALVCGLTCDCRQMGTNTGQSTRVSFLCLLLWQGPQKKGSSLPRGTLGPLQKFSPAVTDSLHGSSGLLRVQNRGCQTLLKLRLRALNYTFLYTLLVKSRHRRSPDRRGSDHTHYSDDTDDTKAWVTGEWFTEPPGWWWACTRD